MESLENLLNIIWRNIAKKSIEGIKLNHKKAYLTKKDEGKEENNETKEENRKQSVKHKYRHINSNIKHK